jgi:hypothetical protein
MATKLKKPGETIRAEDWNDLVRDLRKLRKGDGLAAGAGLEKRSVGDGFVLGLAAAFPSVFVLATVVARWPAASGRVKAKASTIFYVVRAVFEDQVVVDTHDPAISVLSRGVDSSQGEMVSLYPAEVGCPAIIVRWPFEGDEFAGIILPRGDRGETTYYSEDCQGGR